MRHLQSFFARPSQSTPEQVSAPRQAAREPISAPSEPSVEMIGATKARPRRCRNEGGHKLDF